MDLWLGFLFVLLGAICGGSFGLPSKFVDKDTPWETLWGPFFFFVTLLLPLTLGPLLVKGFFGIYLAVGLRGLAPVLVFGLLWGAGSMTLGLSFAFIGLSLAYALNYGAQIVTGSVVPMALHHPEQIATAHGAVILAGVAVCVAGVIVAGRAGILKDLSLRKDEVESADDSKKPRMLPGLILGVVSGVLCACYAVAASYSGDVGAAAKAAGNGPWEEAFAVMALILWGGAVSSCIYCIVKLTQNKTWASLRAPGVGRTLLLAFVMALLHDGAILLFGLGYIKLGALGISVGYAAFMSFAIIVGNVHGFRTGEWKGASRQSIQWIIAGIAVLVLGVCVLAIGKAMAP